MRQIIFVSILLLTVACNSAPQPSADEVINADIEFSQASSESGFSNAFINFAHDEAVLLRDNSMPVVGKTALKNIFEDAPTDGINFTWKPLDGKIAESGELGYTYGIYTLKRDTIVEEGTYVSIWKKDEYGNWKYILDSGNKGLGNK